MDGKTYAVGDAGICPHPKDSSRAVVLMASSAFIQRKPHEPGEVLDMAGCDLSILATGRAPFLADHYRSTDAVLGVIETAWVEGRHAYALIRFAKTQRGAEARDMVHDGILRNASVGFGHGLDDVAKADGVTIIRRWRPYEISLCPVPADWQCHFMTGGLPEAEQRREVELSRLHLAARQREADAIANGGIVSGFIGASAPALAARLSLPLGAVAEALQAEALAYQAAHTIHTAPIPEQDRQPGAMLAADQTIPSQQDASPTYAHTLRSMSPQTETAVAIAGPSYGTRNAVVQAALIRQAQGLPRVASSFFSIEKA